MPKTTTILADGTIIWACRSKRCICDSCKEDQRERTKALDRERYRKKREALGFTVPVVIPPSKDPKPTETRRIRGKVIAEPKVRLYGSPVADIKQYYKRYYAINGEKLRQYARDYHSSKRTLARLLSASIAPAPEIPFDANPSTSC
jgi:hypothetical protein